MRDCIEYGAGRAVLTTVLGARGSRAGAIHIGLFLPLYGGPIVTIHASLDDITSASKGRALYTPSPVALSHLDNDEPHLVCLFHPYWQGAEAFHKTLTGGLGRRTHSPLLSNTKSPA
jgi:hypothetical protein